MTYNTIARIYVNIISVIIISFLYEETTFGVCVNRKITMPVHLGCLTTSMWDEYGGQNVVGKEKTPICEYAYTADRNTKVIDGITNVPTEQIIACRENRETFKCEPDPTWPIEQPDTLSREVKYRTAAAWCLRRREKASCDYRMGDAFSNLCVWDDRKTDADFFRTYLRLKDGRCLAAGPTGGNGANVVAVLCSGWTDAMKWERMEDHTIKNVKTGLCIDVHGPDYTAKKNGGKVQLWNCTGHDNQKISDTNINSLKFNNGLCLELHGPDYESKKDRAPVQQGNCTNSDNQYVKQESVFAS